MLLQVGCSICKAGLFLCLLYVAKRNYTLAAVTVAFADALGASGETVARYKLRFLYKHRYCCQCFWVSRFNFVGNMMLEKIPKISFNLSRV